jgi:hypothetical protein
MYFTILTMYFIYPVVVFLYAGSILAEFGIYGVDYNYQSNGVQCKALAR